MCPLIGPDAIASVDRMCAKFPDTPAPLGKKQYPYTTDLIPLIQALYHAYGPERLMWASDSPSRSNRSRTYAGSIELVRDRLNFLSDEDRQWRLRKSAERVFFSRG